MTEIKHYDDVLVGRKYMPDMEFKFTLSVPNVVTDEFALMVDHDGPRDSQINSMVRLADEGKAPYCVVLSVWPGELLLHDGGKRYMRMTSYDLFEREYGDFVVYELVPYVEEKYGLKISPSPDMHMTSGGSSGGISAFVMAWFHPDYFHRVYMSSPSFLAMGRGNEIPYLIRKYETKPLRIYEECSENEPHDYFGWSRAVIEDAREALTFANYDFKYKFYEGEWHCGRYRDEEEAYHRNEWLWQDWKTPVTAKGNSPRMDKIIPFHSNWERCEAFPNGEETAKPPEPLTKVYDTVVLSNDNYVWYGANKNDDVIHMFATDKAVPEKRHLHATLHTIPHQKTKGGIDMAVDKTDRLFVLTEIGIQCVRSFGLIDAILNLPDASKPLKIAVLDALYVETESGVYKRGLQPECVTDSEEKRKQTSYYD